MARDAYCYHFPHPIELPAVEGTMHLAVVAAESLHGATRVRLDATHALNRRQRTCVIAAGTTVGRDLNRLFAGFVTRGFGAAAVRVERVAGASRTRTSA